MHKSQFRKMDPYGFVVQGHILCLIYQNIISAFVKASVFPLHCKYEFCWYLFNLPGNSPNVLLFELTDYFN